jgi:Tol biopolymer transport system component
MSNIPKGFNCAVAVSFAALAVVSAGGASPPRAPGTIAFSTNDQIFLVRNGRTIQLTHDKPGVVGIGWSPDGSRLLAWRYRRTPAISIVNADGSIGPRVASRVDGEPQWSPDGKWIAFQHWSNGPSEPRGIYVARPDGRDLHRVVANTVPPRLRGGFDWSPDGNRLVYFATVGARSVLLVAQTANERARPIAPVVVFSPGPIGNSGNPAWSPDGSTIAFEDGSGIALVNPDGTALTTLKFPNYVYDPVWSPDGSKLAVAGRFANYVINADGTGLTQLPGRVCKQVWPGFWQRLSWSPDGSMIAYSAGTGPASCTKLSGIYVEKLDGSAATRIASSPTTQYSRPLWRPGQR